MRMAREAFWRMGAPVLAAAVLGLPAVTRAQDEGAEPLARAFRMAGGGSHLGVGLADLGSDDRTRLKLSDERGALVKNVQPDTPAAKAGSRPTTSSSASTARLCAVPPSSRAWSGRRRPAARSLSR
jgi:hypothetical protein